MYKLKIRNKEIEINQFDTSLESVLLMNSNYFNSEGKRELIDTEKLNNFIGLFDKVVSDVNYIKTLSLKEKIYILCKIREQSIGSNFNLKTQCISCQQGFDFETDFNYKIKNGDLDTTKFKGILLCDSFGSVSDCFLDKNQMENLNFDEFENISNYIKEHKSEIKITYRIMCPLCKHTEDVEIDENFIVNNFCSEPLTTFYKTIFQLVYNGHFTYRDIMFMKPYERQIMYSYLFDELKRKADEIKKSNKNIYKSLS